MDFLCYLEPLSLVCCFGGLPLPSIWLPWMELSLAVDLTAPSLVAPGQDENKEKTPPEDFHVLTVWVSIILPPSGTPDPRISSGFLVEKQDI